MPSVTPYTVGVELGFACIQGRYYNMVLEGVSDGDDPQYLPLEFEAAETLPRVDRVVLRLDDNATLLRVVQTLRSRHARHDLRRKRGDGRLLRQRAGLS